MTSKREAQRQARKLRKKWPNRTVNVVQIGTPRNWGIRFSPKGKRDTKFRKKRRQVKWVRAYVGPFTRIDAERLSAQIRQGPGRMASKVRKRGKKKTPRSVRGYLRLKDWDVMIRR